MKSCLVSLCQFKIFQANIINVHFSKASLDPWSGYCFFLFHKSPNEPLLQSVCDCLKGHSAIPSSLKCLTSDLRTRADSRGQRATPEEKPESLKWSARLRMFDLTPQHHHTAATDIPAGWEFFTHSSVWGAKHLSIFKYADGQSEKKQLLWWAFDGYWGDGTHGF